VHTTGQYPTYPFGEVGRRGFGFGPMSCVGAGE